MTVRPGPIHCYVGPDGRPMFREYRARTILIGEQRYEYVCTFSGPITDHRKAGSR